MCDFGARMKIDNAIGEPGQNVEAKHALLSEPDQQRLVWEASHPQEPVDGLTGPADDEMPRTVAAYGDDIEIKVRCGSAIQLKLGAQRIMSLTDRRKIEIAEAHRALQFTGAVANKKDARRMGVDFPGSFSRRKSARAAQERQHNALSVFDARF